MLDVSTGIEYRVGLQLVFRMLTLMMRVHRKKGRSTESDGCGVGVGETAGAIWCEKDDAAVRWRFLFLLKMYI